MNGPKTGQLSLFDIKDNTKTPAEEWSEDGAKHALDELFNATYAYRDSREYMKLMRFVSRFTFYSPYNAMLIRLQRPGARFVATPTRWKRDYDRYVKPNANPIVILQPMGPVMFVFDVSDTEPGPDASPIPIDIDRPFEPQRGIIGDELKMTIESAKRDGIRIHRRETGSQYAGSIQAVSKPHLPKLKFYIGKDKGGIPRYKKIPVQYELLFSKKLSPEARYTTLVHELAHLYCGHLGTPNKKWWPDRLGLSHAEAEFEAESVTYLVCARVGIENPSAAYLSGYVKTNEKLPKISLECVMKAAGLIENMGKERMKPRKD
ncbi:MAG: hypothetical protein ISS65_02235 [Desulfobacterales bacterium]|uniref:IrrE N-terminal-like domain-containing protein n=1 Tax=Candidatus Desulfatibia profunda TaxID=2841695 RepID=A0A8J6NW26_9BACT|nr:hypothetical protein [Candidatus Desulfatibia profunda]MBL7179012.1 hypothetical protein [Desulfobacterales bacterium]